MYGKEDWNYYWNRPYTRYEGHQSWFWETALPFVISPVLDLGCGPASLWKGTNHEVTGIDYSEKAIQEAQRNYPQGKFQVADVESYVSDDSYNTVLSCGLVHYFIPDKLDLMQKIHCKPALKRVIITVNTPVDLTIFKDWGKLVYAQFKDKIGWVLVFDVVESAILIK